MSFPKSMQFSFPWRTYQQRVLSELNKHLSDDDTLHIIAPPGSGKTVLGLEVAHRLNKPTLILSPTLTIRNQWAERLTKDFLKDADTTTPEWLTFDIKNPKFLTISTYQALHAAAKGDMDALIKKLQDAGIQTLIVDECHHLQREWWRSLNRVVKTITPTIVALTATPPYDVSRVEWERYHNLCGNIDAEINVGELVAEGNLCPHQDYIYFSKPTEGEVIELQLFQTQLDEIFENVRSSGELLDIVKQHPFLIQPKEYENEIFDYPAYFTAILTFLEWTETLIPLPVWEMIGTRLDNLPPMDEEWLEILLQGIFFTDDYFEPHRSSPYFKQLQKALKKIGAISRKNVQLTQPDKLQKQLKASTSKIKSIEEIVTIEYETLGQDLRMVILTDYIRKEAMPKNELDIEPIQQIGVVPIFELVRRKFPVRIELGILSGSLVIIPKYSEALFDRIALEYGIPANEITKKPLPHDEMYLQVIAPQKFNNKVVQIMTRLFEEGGITVLVGTKALLGEGWDAPAINSLIMASFVGSYVLSNQMRGRAIRIQKGNPNKTGNIWHLICLDPTQKSGGADFEMLKRRFKAFYGVSFNPDPVLENGIDRFSLPDSLSFEKIPAINTEMQSRAVNRPMLIHQWNKALKKGVQMREEIAVPAPQSEKIQSRKVVLHQQHQDIVNDGIDLFNGSMIITLIIYSALVFLLFGTGIWNWLLQFSMWWWLTLSFVLTGIYHYFKFIFVFTRFKPKLTIRRLTLNFHWLFIAIAAYFVITLFGSSAIFAGLLAVFFIGIIGLVLNPTIQKVVTARELYQEFNHLSSHVKGWANATLATLSATKRLDTPHSALNINLNVENDAVIECSLNGGSTYDEQIFITSLNEVTTAVDNPRYIIKVTADKFGILNEPYYVAVPDVLGRNKLEAETFLENWRMQAGDGELIYTRTFAGRKELMKARLLNIGEEKPKRISSWK